MKVNEDLLDIMEYITGKLSRVLPITTQDITPYDNQIYHINSIMQPATITDAPVIGVAITTQTSVPGYMTGASHIIDLEECGRFLIEVCKFYSREEKSYYDEEEYQKLLELYGSINYFKL